MKNDILAVRFDLLCDSFGDGSDPICNEDVNAELHDSWHSYLDAGCDAAKVAEMMSAQDVWDHYDELKGYGVDIDLGTVYNKLAEVAECQNWDTDSYILATGSTIVTLETLKDRGASDDLILESGLGEFTNLGYIEKLLSLGVDADKVFARCGEILNDDSNMLCNMQYDLLSVFHKHGYPVEKIEAWVNEHAKVDSFLLDDLIINDDDWSKLGVVPSNYADRWLQSSTCRNRYIDDALNYGLPKCISQERYISTISADELIKEIEGIQAFYKGDIDVVAKIILDAKGYPDGLEDEDLLYAYCILYDCNSKLIDRDKVIACVKASTISDNDKESYYEWLS